MTSALPIVRLGINVVASVGVSKVVNDIIRYNTNVETTADAVKVAAGALVLGSIVADTASDHVNKRIDQVANWNKNRKAKKEDSN
jgi:hypothetical protein